MEKTCGGKSISAEALLIQLSHFDLVWKSIDWEMDGRVDWKQESHVFQADGDGLLLRQKNSGFTM
jgi:hypothetical protein